MGYIQTSIQESIQTSIQTSILALYRPLYRSLYRHLYSTIQTSILHYTDIYTHLYTHKPSTTNSLYLLIFAILYNEAFDSPLLKTLTPSTPTAHIETHTYVLTHMTLPPITYIPPPTTTNLHSFLPSIYYKIEFI
jgi:hypothetical protein